jgi:flavin reductase (DIM6/NTAB) family NADH-FMN oxidoreductase RutF
MSGEDLQQAFRMAMRRVASTVAIVSAQRGSERHGTTATSMTSISMEPPSILVCFNKVSRLHDFLHAQDHFCVNVLHTSNLAIAKIFSSSATAEERFGLGDWRLDAEGTPYLAGAQANLFCSKEQEVTYGSHTIFIGRVLRALSRDDVSPLLYRDGRYGECAADTVDVT